jgi:shikimate dehydrogenase
MFLTDKIFKIRGSENTLGIIGYPVSHSLSPLMHNTAIRSLSLEYHYYPFQIRPEELSNAVNDIRNLGIKGINVTIPHKEPIIDLLDDINRDARLIGAVNTVNREGEKLVGYNTDGKGFIKSLREDAKVDPKGKNILILGAGGAARGLAIQLSLEKTNRIVIANRTLKRAEELVKDLKEKVGFCECTSIPLEDKIITDYIPDSDIIINATSLGMKGEDSPIIHSDLITKRHLVCDIVYSPLETPLLKEAKMRGAKVLNGLGMLIYQGALSFEIWTGKEFPVDLVRETLIKELDSIDPHK